jgi:hypothetical protein
MAGWGYVLRRPQIQTPTQRLAGIVGGMDGQADQFDRQHPAPAYGHGDPVTPGALGAQYLDLDSGHLWYYTSLGWLTGDSQHRYAKLPGDSASSGASYVDTGLQVGYHLGAGGGFVNLFMFGSYWASAGTSEFAVTDDIDVVDARMISVSNTSPIALMSTPGSSTGTYFGYGGQVTWAASPGDHVLRVRARNSGGTAFMRDGRLFVVVL